MKNLLISDIVGLYMDTHITCVAFESVNRRK